MPSTVCPTAVTGVRGKTAKGDGIHQRTVRLKQPDIITVIIENDTSIPSIEKHKRIGLKHRLRRDLVWRTAPFAIVQ